MFAVGSTLSYILKRSESAFALVFDMLWIGLYDSRRGGHGDGFIGLAVWVGTLFVQGVANNA